jgi:hypothetical protein
MTGAPVQHTESNDVSGTATGRDRRQRFLLFFVLAVITSVGLVSAVVRRTGDRVVTTSDSTTTIAAQVVQQSSPASAEASVLSVAPTIAAAIPASAAVTIPPTAAVTVAPSTSPGTSVQPSSSTGLAVAVPAASQSLPGGQLEDFPSWPVIGQFSGVGDLQIVATTNAQFNEFCFGVRVAKSPATFHDFCNATPAAVVLIDGRVVVMSSQAVGTSLTVRTTAGDITAKSFATGFNQSGSNNSVGLAGVLVPASVEITGVGDSKGVCPYRALLASNEGRSITPVSCVATAAVAGSVASASIAQPDTIYFDLDASGVWLKITNGGDPCAIVSDGTTEDTTQVAQSTSRLRKACVALGEIKG